MGVCEQHKNMEDNIKNINKKLDGNGRPGLLERMSRVETKQSILLWLNGLMAGAMIASILRPLIGG